MPPKKKDTDGMDPTVSAILIAAVAIGLVVVVGFFVGPYSGMHKAEKADAKFDHLPVSSKSVNGKSLNEEKAMEDPVEIVSSEDIDKILMPEEQPSCCAVSTVDLVSTTGLSLCGEDTVSAGNAHSECAEEVAARVRDEDSFGRRT